MKVNKMNNKNNNFLNIIYDVIQKNSLNLEFIFYKNEDLNELLDISNKTFKIILKEWEDNLNNNSAAKVNRTLNSEELKDINNSKIYVNLTNSELDLNVGLYKFELISTENGINNTEIQATINITESINK